MRQLQLDTQRSRRSAFAVGTFKNLHCQWVKYLRFCSYFRLVAFPANTSILSWYAQYLSCSLRAHTSIVAYLAGVKTLHKMLNHSTTGFTGFHLKLTMLGLRRNNKHVTKRARPITPAILRAIHSQLNLSLTQDIIFWGICLLAFFLMFRKSNLIPDTKNGFDPTRQLRRTDVTIQGESAVVGIRWAKNEQFSRELLTFPLPRLPGSVLCPVTAVKNILSIVPGHPAQHLFALPDGTSFSYRNFQQKLRETLLQAGFDDVTSFSSHSFRRGSTTFSFLCGIPSAVIRVLGNWRSDCYLKYIEFPLETRTAASELMKQRILAWDNN